LKNSLSRHLLIASHRRAETLKQITNRSIAFNIAKWEPSGFLCGDRNGLFVVGFVGTAIFRDAY
jgi:hypothetical protein